MTKTITDIFFQTKVTLLMYRIIRWYPVRDTTTFSSAHLQFSFSQAHQTLQV